MQGQVVYAQQPVVYAQQQQVAVPQVKAYLPEFRKVMARQYPQYVQITHNAENMERKCCGNKEVYDSTYTWVMENRVEWNRPFKTCCGGVQDNVTVVYYDDFKKAKDATPCCSGCRGTGEVVKLNNTCCCCIPCNLHVIGHLKDAIGVVAAINEAKKRLDDLTGGWD